ncbi:MAG: VRR-NUC domain-containing protein [[Clostridium] aminophilum]|uniref:VRR-NUC domain-containing protein n=1 Tax=[Clostridium] aminophilum TaxID=1526 RepID=UPI0026EC4F93|nr:VRR-NUC domain-containing protein [[Clostridium] aminophilum]MDD6197471.1 VRR-NUC domain-containing protein [[Clostridium] aminophilum]
MNHQFEEREQMALMHWAAYYESEYPELVLLFHIPNGGTRNKREAGRLKAAGVKAGVPDLCLPVPRGRWHGLWIEMKYGQNKPTVKQKDWIRRLRLQGYRVEVCYGQQEASEVILEYLEGEKND